MKLITTKDHRLPEECEEEAGRESGKHAGKRGRGMRRMCAAAVWLLLLLGGGTAHALNVEIANVQPKAPRMVKDQVVAKVNGMPILAADLDLMVKAQVKLLQYQFANDPARLAKELAEVKRNALNGLIDIQLLEDEFFRLGGTISQEDIDEDVKYETQAAFRGDRKALMAELSTLGMTYDKYRELRERIIIVSAVRARIANHVEVTDAMVREHYEKNLGRWREPETVRLHTLTISRTTANARRLAEGLRMRLVNGADFAETAREFSADSRAEEGGAWSWTNLGEISAKVGQVIAKTKPGMLSGVIEEAGAFIVLRVDARREGKLRPYESVKEEVRKSLVEELGRQQLENRLCRLREAADIQRMGSV